MEARIASSLNEDNRPDGLSANSFRDLRKRAIEKANDSLVVGEPQAATQERTLALLEELRIHQIELEMQNEELRRAQAELQASRSRYFDLYDLAPVGYVTVNEAGAIQQANLRAATLFATDRSFLARCGFSQFIAPDGQDAYYLARKRLNLGGEPHVCEFKMLRLDRSQFWARLEMSLAQEDTALVCRIVIADITERQQLEEALRFANSQLAAEKHVAEEATRSKSHFLSAMSHEIRTPLNGVIGMAGLLLHTKLSAEQRDYARIVADSAEALLGLVSNILDFSKIEAGKFELDEVPFDLESLIEDVLDLTSFQAHEKSLELACWYPSGGPSRFLGDAMRLRQVLMNLISNAIKFTQSGYVLVEVTAAAPMGGKSAVRIAIHDTGIGISKENQSRLFVSFNQADPTIARRFGGTGLGLTITKQIVEVMGGEIGVASMEGEGSTFYCTLPLKVELSPSRPAADDASLAGLSVLACGGRQIGRYVVAEWCQRWGMKVDQCDLGQLADYLKSAANGGPAFQLIIADGSLDDLSEVVSEFHSNAGNRPPKLVLLTSDPVEKSKHLAADALLYTPLRVKAFWDKLRELLPNVRVQPPPSAPFSSRISGKAPPLGTGKVLVADDNLINQKLACALLSRLGCQVDTADNGAEAVKKVGLGGYELVFMDCVMPEMDGFAATSAIRSLAGRCGAVPIVALTASATTEDRDHCLAVGMNDFLTKPIRSEQLAASITKWIPRHAG